LDPGRFPPASRRLGAPLLGVNDCGLKHREINLLQGHRMIFKLKQLRLPRPRLNRGSFLLLITNIIFLIFTSQIYSALPSPIKIESKEGVDSAQVKAVTLAINDTVQFFSDNYQFVLKNRLLMILVPDEKTYESVLRKDFGQPPAKAKKDARNTAGKAKDAKGQYMMAVKAYQSETKVMTVICHEMVHWYQYQTEAKKAGQIKWLLEGTANVIAYYIIDQNKKGFLKKSREGGLKTIQNAKRVPSLRQLYSRKDFNTAVDKYGGKVVYAKATLAVLTLAQRKGYKQVFRYFLNLKKHNLAQAFELAFGLNLHEFEKEMDQKFGK
jgi:hypothetical protein